MAGSTFLHVQAHGEAAIRILELPEGPVRVGRSHHCEVRLDGPDALGDVQCILRPRGEGWQFQPVGPAGLVWIDDRPADQQRPLVLGIPFRVGNHWLTLRSAENATNDWGSFASPITVEPAEAAGSGPEPEPRPIAPRPIAPRAIPAPPPTVIEAPAAPASAEESDDRLTRWQSRLDQRERWIKDRQDEKRWEARWKAAGESIKAPGPRPSAPASASAPAPPPPPTLSAPPASQPPPPSPAPVRIVRPAEPRAVARPVDPRPSEPLRRVIDPASRPEAPRFPTGPRTTRPTPLGQPQAGRPSGGFAPGVRANPLVSHGGPRVDWASVRAEPLPIFAAPPPPFVAPRPAPAPTAPAIAPAANAGALAPYLPIEAKAETVATEPEIEPSLEEVAKSVEVDPEPEPEIEAFATVDLEPSRDEASPFETETFDILPATWVEPEFHASPAKVARSIPAPARPSPEAGPAAPPWPESAPRDVSRPHDPSAAEWPTARSIFAAQGRRLDGSPEPAPAPARGPSRAAVRRSRVAVPTEAIAPGEWTLPFWLGWFPTAALALALGIIGLALCHEWVVDATSGSQAIRIATRDAKSAGPSFDIGAIPRGPWWRTTAGHLSAWAMAVERIADGEDHSADVRALMDDARHVSPLAAGSRFVLETAPAAESDPIPLLFQVGRPRDGATLAWTGRHLRGAGKVQASLGAFRSAFAIAANAARRDLDPPAYSKDPRYRRYALPHEELLGFVARVMVSSGDWTAEQWDEALPALATARVAAAKALREKDRAGSDRILDRVIARADEPSPDPSEAGEDRAGVAEALALRDRPTGAIEAYGMAIDAVADDLTRRRWWINLADIAQRGGDKAARNRALEAARGTETTDEITRLALELQQDLAGATAGRPGP